MVKIRLNKFLADSGIASRRGADALIDAGKVAVDGLRARLGDSIDPSHNSVTVNGKRVWPSEEGANKFAPLQFKGDLTIAQLQSKHVTLVLNKPLHVITSMRDEHGRKTVAAFLPTHRRLFPVGRLDAETSGLLLCTTDGALSRFLTHPSSQVPRSYEVVARGILTEETIEELGARNMKKLADGSHSFTVVLTEGKNRQVRRMCARKGLRIISLTRTRFGPIQLGKLKPGSTRPLTEHELRELDQLRAKRSRS